MLKHLKSHGIVRTKWEACVRSSASSTVYASSFFLDALPEDWEAIVDERIDLNGNSYYYSVLPFQIKRKAFLKYVLQNPFLNELGPIQYSERGDANTSDLDLLKMAFQSMLYIRNYSMSEEIYTGDLQYKLDLSFYLNLNQCYESMYKEYSNNRKRELKKAKANGLKFNDHGCLEELIKLHERWVLPKVEGMYTYQYETLRSLYHTLRQHFTLFIATVDTEDCTVASGLFIVFNQRIAYFFGATSGEGKRTGASTFLFDSIIKKNSNSKYMLDFNGGNLKSLAYFYKGFGAKEKYYKVFSMNRFPLPIKKIHQASIWLRRKVLNLPL